VHKRNKKQFSTTQTRPHRSNTVKHWRTWWKQMLLFHSRPEQVEWKYQPVRNFKYCNKLQVW